METYRCQKIWLWRQRTPKRLSVRTVRVGIKKLSRVGKRVPDTYFAFRFGAKLTFRGNQRICTSKNAHWRFLCPTYDNIFANKFLKLFNALCLVTRLVTLQEQPSLPPPCLVKILTADSWIKIYDIKKFVYDIKKFVCRQTCRLAILDNFKNYRYFCFELLNSWVFVEEGVAKEIYRWLCLR